MGNAVKSSAELGRDDLVLCNGTVMNASFSELVAAARAGGFNAISLFAATYRNAREQQKLSDADLRNMLADNGLCIAELDPLLNWVPGHVFPGGGPALDADEDTFYRMADALGARSLNVVWALPQRLPDSQLIDAYAALCDRASSHGLLAHLEFLPWSQINDVVAACAIVRQAGRDNGGILLDSWHHFRAGTANAVIAQIPGRHYFGVQLNDAPAQADADPIDETMRARLLPGDGDIDLVDLIRQLDRSGSNAPIGIEVFSTPLWRLSAEEVGRQAGEKLRKIVAAARA